MSDGTDRTAAQAVEKYLRAIRKDAELGMRPKVDAIPWTVRQWKSLKSILWKMVNQ